ncbi:AAA family ATPase [Bacteroides pyogenes]|uniref:AAA family ATPase n=1 Tax=Bacteroides pyogenes TaxID=310300 RepID=UPI002A802456|nr:AAA family ATPase [Bacteroides pyogenes]MDY4249857.1 AAA family ATPase [Bacteroides pyogenes]
MRIIAIRLKNLTSIEGSVELDFTAEPLRSAGIFAISGPTGAGKSTLLDALCLALYDKAPRFAASVESIALADVGENQVNQSDVRNMLRRGTGDGYAEVDFQAVDGHRYRSRWSVRRTRYKVDGSLQPQVLEVKDLDTGKELQGTKRELLAQLAERTGLTYEQFTRTVLLAQNDFATFLKSKGAAKAELLEKLTGTGIYSLISQEVFARNKAVQEEMALIESKKNVIELIPEEELLLLQKEKETEGEKRSEGIRRLAELNTQLTIVNSLKTQEELWKKKQNEELEALEKKEKAQEVLSVREEELARFKEQWEAIQPDLRKARELDVQIRSQQGVYAQSERSLQEIRSQLKAGEAKYRSFDKQLNDSYHVLGNLLNHGETKKLEIEEAESILSGEEERLKEEETKSEALLKRVNDFGYPSKMEERNRLQKELERSRNIRKLTDTRMKIEEEKRKLEKESGEVANCLADCESVLNTVQRLYDNARMAVGKDVKALRRQLKEGEACPVCGSKKHPYHEESEAVDAIFRNMELEYKAASEAYRRANNRNIAVQRDLAHQKKLEEELAAQLALLQEEGAKNVSEDELKTCLNELEKKILSYRNLYAEWQQSDELLKRKRDYCRTLRTNVAQHRLFVQKSLAAREQLSLLRHAAAAELAKFEEIEKALNGLKHERAGLLKGKDADEAEIAVAKREKDLTVALDKSRQEVENVRNKLSGLQGEMKQLSAVIDDLRERQQRIEQPDRLAEAIEKQQEENLHTERALSVIEARLLQQAKNRATMEEIEKELADKSLSAERWAKLNKLIGSADGAKFKVIAQSYTLNLLLWHANKHLSYLSKRYKLQQVPETLGLQVIDLDMCDEVRTVYSLSGGESFLISLALALGLSSLSSNNLTVESLFIDEGFGSLDTDSLRTAMEALEQLQMQGRKIGVISHVQEMSERIAVQVQVQKKANGKSVITVVG